MNTQEMLEIAKKAANKTSTITSFPTAIEMKAVISNQPLSVHDLILNEIKETNKLLGELIRVLLGEPRGGGKI